MNVIDGSDTVFEEKILNVSSSESLKGIGMLGFNQSVNYELVEMHLIELRKFIAVSTFNWNTKMSEFFKKTKFDDDEEDFIIECAQQTTPVVNITNLKTNNNLKTQKYNKQISNLSNSSSDPPASDLITNVLVAQQNTAELLIKSHNDSQYTAYRYINNIQN